MDVKSRGAGRTAGNMEEKQRVAGGDKNVRNREEGV